MATVGINSSLTVTSRYDNVIQSDSNGISRDSFNMPQHNQDYAPGTAAGLINRAYRDTASLTGSSKTYTLSTLTGATGMTKARKLLLKVTTAIGGGGSGTLAPGSSNGWSAGIPGPIPLNPNSIIVLTWPDAGVAVASGSSDTITVTTTGTLAYTLEIEGVGP